MEDAIIIKHCKVLVSLVVGYLFLSSFLISGIEVHIVSIVVVIIFFTFPGFLTYKWVKDSRKGKIFYASLATLINLSFIGGMLIILAGSIPHS